MVRKASRGKLVRRGPQRESYDRVLIACVGERTETQYFQELRDAWGISTANVVIVPSNLDPMGLVKLARKKRREERKNGEDYDRVYCVFDHDDQAHFESASQAAEADEFRLARSWPCFEFWFLLHFEYTRQPFGRSGGKSKCDNCISALKRHLPGYAKHGKDRFRELEERLGDAMNRADRALTDAQSTEECNPSTEVHELVRYLKSIKS
ncbi:MAG: RloB family protein [Gammaproteobacteria bacterium]|nr:RloB family protein [Gammaproteobacteria bacterium]